MADIIEIQDIIENYFLEQNENIEIKHIDTRKIVIRDTFSGAELAIPFYNEKEKIDNLIKEYSGLSVEDEDTVYSFFNDFKNILDIKRIAELNKKLDIFPDVGYKLGNTVELLFSYSVTDCELCVEENVSHCETFDMWEFVMGDSKVKINTPSSFFQLIFSEYETDDFYVGWYAYSTVLITGINKENYEDIFQQVLFWIYQMCPSVYAVDFPEIGQLYYEDTEGEADIGEVSKGKHKFQNEYENMEFNISKYEEPIYFYNAAKRINDTDFSFLYFYKILEFFFFISQKEGIEKIANQYNDTEDIETFITSMQGNFFGKKEDILLINLIDSMDSDLINDIGAFAVENGLIPKNQNDTLSEELYKHRNSITHGKFEYKNTKLRKPNRINDLKGTKWTELIERLSFSLIVKHCYQK